MVWRHRSALCQFHSWTSFSLTPPHVLTKWHQRRHHCSCQVWSIFLAGLQWWRENALKKKHKRETIKVHMFWQYCLPSRCFCVFFFLESVNKKSCEEWPCCSFSSLSQKCSRRIHKSTLLGPLLVCCVWAWIPFQACGRWGRMHAWRPEGVICAVNY